MKVHKTSLDGPLVIEPVRFADQRGFFLECFQMDRYRQAGIREEFVQDNHSRSYRNVLRGLHFQNRRPQAQIVTVMRGRIFDVVVDLRAGSASYGRWYGAVLAEDGPTQMYMPPGFAHGFCVLSELADLHYKVSEMYDPADEGGLLWCDPQLAIAWPVDNPQVSSRDAAYPRLCEIPPQRLPSVRPDPL